MSACSRAGLRGRDPSGALTATGEHVEAAAFGMDIEVEFEPLGDGSSVEVLIGDVDDYYLLKGTFTWAIWSGWAYDPEDEEITSDEIEWGLPLDEVVALLQNAVSEDADLRNDGALRNVIERGALETGEMAACIVLPIDEFLVEIAAELETPIPMDELAGRPKKSVLSSSGHRSPNKALEDPIAELSGPLRATQLGQNRLCEGRCC